MNTINAGYASFGRRLVALIVDVIILKLITLPLMLALYGTEYLTSGGTGNPLGVFLINWVLPAAITWPSGSRSPPRRASCSSASEW
jgi:uncharacterized RDD family membrane protein YckC